MKRKYSWKVVHIYVLLGRLYQTTYTVHLSEYEAVGQAAECNKRATQGHLYAAVPFSSKVLA